MSRDGAGVLERMYGRLDSEQYRNILENVLFPVARERFPKRILLFQQDNFSAHTAQDVEAWFAERLEIEDS